MDWDGEPREAQDNDWLTRRIHGCGCVCHVGAGVAHIQPCCRFPGAMVPQLGQNAIDWRKIAAVLREKTNALYAAEGVAE